MLRTEKNGCYWLAAVSGAAFLFLLPASSQAQNLDGTCALVVGTDATGGGDGCIAAGNDVTALGTRAQAQGNDSSAFGTDSLAAGNGNTAVGDEAEAFDTTSGGTFLTGTGITAVGQNAHAHRDNATAIGQEALALGVSSTAVGQDAEAQFLNSTAIGQDSRGLASGATAFGQNAVAQGTDSTAVGRNSNVGAGTTAGTAVGFAANALHSDFTAIGTGATTTTNNQIMYGRVTETHTMAGIATDLSRSRQTGPLEVVTSDAFGNLATDGGEMFDDIDRNKNGVAVALALANPDLVGNEKFGIAVNYGNFEGAGAVGGAVTGVVADSLFGDTGRFAVSGGLGIGFDEGSVGGRVGGQLTW